MSRDEMLAKIDALYAGRASGDVSAFEEILTPDSEFRFAGDTTIVAAFPGGTTRDPTEVAQDLFAKIDMLDREQVSSVVEGNRVSVLTKATLRVPGREPFEHLMFDLWEFTDDGRIKNGMQFQDTAKIIAELKAGEG